MKVELRDGADQRLTFGTVPLDESDPDMSVIAWDGRMFLRDSRGATAEDGSWIYRERIVHRMREPSGG